jgi:hypothetical protein
MKNSYRVYGYAPAMFGQSGHSSRYHESIYKALNFSKVVYSVAIPCGSTIQNSYCDRVIVSDFSSFENLRLVKNKVLRFFLHVKSYSKKLNYFIRYIERNNNPSDKKIVFLEQSTPVELLLFFVFLKVKSIKVEQIWYVLRGEQDGINLFFLKACDYVFDNKKISLHYMADSELIADYMKEKIKANIDMIPIPHTNINCRESIDFSKGVKFWWPGYPGIEKGLNLVRRMLSVQPNTKTPFTLYVSNQANLTSDNITIHNLKAVLNDNEYTDMFSTASLVIFPYLDTKKGYLRRTSGPFVEAIISGSMVLVNKGTWMDYELSKYSLEELIIDWEERIVDKSIFPIIEKNLSNSEVVKKLNLMRDDYMNFHSVPGVNKCLTKYLI